MWITDPFYRIARIFWIPLNEWNLMTVLVVLAGICAISAVKSAALGRLINLN